MPRSIPWAALVLGLLLLGSAPRQVLAKDTPKAALARAQSLLGAGKASEALEVALKGLELDTGDLDLLTLASDAAAQADRKDEALWFARLATQRGLTSGASGPIVRALQNRVEKLEPLEPALRKALADYGKAMLDAGLYCAKRKLYGNAVDLLQRAAVTPSAVAAREQLERIYKSKKAVAALLGSDLDVPLKLGGGRSERWIKKEDKKHGTWKKAWEIKSKNYTVVTNMGWEMATAMSDAMEQINVYYRRIFDHKVGGGSMARCTIHVYGTRKLFELHENENDPHTKGFYVPGENRVAAYDPRTEGSSLASLWETLFHECTHQFIDTITTGDIPEWLNEGTATYFEGADLEANGRVREGIDDNRLEYAVDAIKASKPTLRAVVSWRGTDFPGEYYPVCGMLVYFLKYYEDESGKRPYQPIYLKYLDSYSKGGKHDIFDRFVEYFVKKAKQPGIESFKDFEERWRAWTLELGDLYFGPPDRAEKLIERAGKQREQGRLDAAVETYRWALGKRPDDAPALQNLARTLTEAKRKDEAIATWRRLAFVARGLEADAWVPRLEGVTGGQLGRTCAEEIGRLEPRLAELVADADAACVRAAAATADAYVEKGFSRNALYTLQGAIEALQGARGLASQRSAIAKESKASIQLWQRLPLEDDLASWFGHSDWKAAGGKVVGVADHPRRLLFVERLPARYAFEVTIRPIKGMQEPIYGLVFGVDERDITNVYSATKDGTLDVDEFGSDWKLLKSWAPLSADERSSFTLGVEVEGNHVRFFVNGKLRGTLDFPQSHLKGRVGFILQEGEAEFSEPRLAR